MRLSTRFAAFAFWALPGSSWACSLSGEFMAASNFELVQMADAIVVAVAEQQPSGEHVLPQVEFRTEMRVKGLPPPRFNISLASLGSVSPSDNEDLSSPHHEAFSGACNRATFQQGGRYLIFLDQDEGGHWNQLGMPFARVNEDYTGEGNSWMRSVRRYLTLQQSIAPMDQLAALTRMAETGEDSEGRPLRAAERADIEAHLGWISPWKPTLWLLDLYGRLERGEPLPFALSERPDDPEEAYDRAAADFLGEEFPEGSAGRALQEAEAASPEEASRKDPPAIDSLRLRILRSLMLGNHPAALPLFERLWTDPETARPLRGLILRYFARNGEYTRAYRWIENNLMRELSALPRHEALSLLQDVEAVQRGNSWEAGRERWRSDPHAAANWPALSRSINRYQIRTFGRDYALPFFDLDE